MIYSLYQPLFIEYLKTGGFPQVVLTTYPEERTALLYDILYSYITVDVKTLADLKKTTELEKLIRLLPSRIGQKLDISKSHQKSVYQDKLLIII
jgi:hypothetical protein